ncbi:MAG: hypothetical protein C0462_12270 [Alcanivorax sp.]|nr:hypothetical protein [Alcanivorax sp.]
MKVSVIIPVFNDADALPELLTRLQATAHRQSWALDVILVDDGSRDEVWTREKALPAAMPDLDLTLVRLNRNHGQSLATLQGLLLARGDYLVTLDADLQHPPESIPALLSALTATNFPLAYASNRDGHGLFRRALSVMRRLLVAPLGTSLPHASSFRALDRSFFDARVRPDSQHIFNIDEAFSWFAPGASLVDTPHHPRKHNTSSYTLPRLLRFAVRSAWYSRHLPRGLLVISLGLMSLAMLLSASSRGGSIAVQALGIVAALSLGASVLARRHHARHTPGHDLRIVETIRGPDASR